MYYQVLHNGWTVPLSHKNGRVCLEGNVSFIAWTVAVKQFKFYILYHNLQVGTFDCMQNIRSEKLKTPCLRDLTKIIKWK